MPISSNKSTGQAAKPTSVFADSNLQETDQTKSISALANTAMVLGGYEAGFDLVKGNAPDAIEQFTVISSRNGTPRLLLPRSAAMMQPALSCFLGTSPMMKLAQPIFGFCIRLGGPFSRFTSDVSLTSQSGRSSALRVLIENVLGRKDFQMALRMSFGRPNGKTVAVAISEAGEPLCYVKLGSEPMTSALVAHESETLEQFKESDIQLIVPQALYSGCWVHDHQALITAPLQLERLSRDAHLAHEAADALATQNLQPNCTLLSSEYWQRTKQRVQAQQNGDELPNTLAEIERCWGSREFDFGVSHGDWSRANVGMSMGRVAAIDWERRVEYAPRGIDIAHFSILEISSRRFFKTLHVDQLAAKVRHILKALGLPEENAEPLILFALLEMVIRFRSAKTAGLNTTDSKFAPALNAGIDKWIR
jgi:hypothetical protein